MKRIFEKKNEKIFEEKCNIVRMGLIEELSLFEVVFEWIEYVRCF